MEIVTERLIIRTLQETDYPDHMIYNVEAFEGDPRGQFNWIVSQYANMDIVHDIISLGIFQKDTNAYCGYVGAGKHVELNEPEIFYYLLPQKRGFGYATEAVAAVTKWVFDNYFIPYLIGTVGVDNLSSQAVLDRCGYELIEHRISSLQGEDQQSEYKYYRFYPAI